MDQRLENRIRRVIKARMRRGQRDAVAHAAGHEDGSWVSNWLAGRQKAATLDELAAMLKKLNLSLAKVIDAPDADDLDWEVFGLVGRLSEDRKRLALKLIAGIVEHAATIDEERPTLPMSAHLQQAGRKARQ